MRFRNYIPLMLLIFFTLPGGLGFIYLWEGYPLVIAVLQLVQLVFLLVVYRAGIRSAQKNFPSLPPLGKILYLPFKVNSVLYLLIGQPLIWIFYTNSTILMAGHALALTGFVLTYFSGLTYIKRSAA